MNRPIAQSLALLAAFTTSPVLAQDIPSTDAPSTLPQLVQYMTSDAFRDRYPLKFKTSTTHRVSAPNASLEEGFDLFFASYDGEVPAGINIAVIGYSNSGGQHGAYYLCPENQEPCTYDPDQTQLMSEAEISYFSSHNQDIRRLGGGQYDYDIYPIETDRKGRMEGKFHAEFTASSKEMERFCLSVTFIPSKFFGMSEGEPQGAGTYCYDFALQRVTTSFGEMFNGYVPSDAQTQQMKADFEAILGVPLRIE